jgi:dinuclear metal center YbgI/SA1388 family protein
MNVKLNTLVKFLNKELKIKSIKDESINGLQVRASNEINKVGLATDACMDVFEKAKRLDCDLLIVHHGIFWKNKKDVGMNKKNVSFLKKNKISVYAAHLPLDKHAKYGNNIMLFEMLNANAKELFGRVGYLGYLEKIKDINSIKKELDKKLGTKCKVWKFGKSKIKKIAVVSGYGATEIPEAIKKDVDLFITGEASHGSYLRSKDGKITVLIAGHYKTETLGVKALGKLLKEKFNLETVFIDNPTGL